ncbi:hypothetical protein DFH09DRAFT_1274488 [Mycena vulgaris]|nr:hypothetical protein DFH09DRAFT_1274488 [Mycena vulgaris]
MGGKRKGIDENTGQFLNTSGPPQKQVRSVPKPLTEASMLVARKQWEDRQQEEAAARADFLAQREREEEAERSLASSLRIRHVLDAVKTAGYKTLHEFIPDLLGTKDQHQSSQVSQMLINHGEELLDLILGYQGCGEILYAEGVKLAQRLRPEQGQSVTTTLAEFSLERILADAEYIAPTLCCLLRVLARDSNTERPVDTKGRDADLLEIEWVCGENFAGSRHQKIETDLL